MPTLLAAAAAAIPPALCCASRHPLQGAIIIVGVMGLLDYPEFIYLWKTNKFDWVVWNVAFLFTIFLVRACLRVCWALVRRAAFGCGWRLLRGQQVALLRTAPWARALGLQSACLGHGAAPRLPYLQAKLYA